MKDVFVLTMIPVFAYGLWRTCRALDSWLVWVENLAGWLVMKLGHRG